MRGGGTGVASRQAGEGAPRGSTAASERSEGRRRRHRLGSGAPAREVSQDRIDGLAVLDTGEEAKPPAAGRAGCDIDAEHAPQASGPAARDESAGAGGWLVAVGPLALGTAGPAPVGPLASFIAPLARSASASVRSRRASSPASVSAAGLTLPHVPSAAARALADPCAQGGRQPIASFNAA